jgi:hypothetical protein
MSPLWNGDGVLPGYGVRMVKPTLWHFYQRGRADAARNTPGLHAPQTDEDVRLCGEAEAQAAYTEGFESVSLEAAETVR